MKKATQSHPEGAPDLRTRATALKASLVRITGTDQAAAEASDPIFAAIGLHRTARAALNACCTGADTVAVRQRGGDTSDEAMAPAVEVRDAAERVEVKAWNAIFAVRPTTLAGTSALIRYAKDFATEVEGREGSISLSEAFDAVADTVDDLRAMPASTLPDQRGPGSFGTTVEAELVALNDQYEAIIAVYDQTGEMNTGLTADPDSNKAIELVIAHAIRVSRGILQTALALPACSTLAIGLQARLIASESSHLWGADVEFSEAACRDLLVRLMGLAGLKPIVRPEVSPDQLQRWLDDPETRPGASRYREGGVS